MAVSSLVMDHDQNFSKSRVNVISLLPICVKREIRELLFPPFVLILSGKLAHFNVILRNLLNLCESAKMGVNNIELK